MKCMTDRSRKGIVHGKFTSNLGKWYLLSTRTRLHLQLQDSDLKIHVMISNCVHGNDSFIKGAHANKSQHHGRISSDTVDK